jgi:hypothetical protein
LFFRTWDNSTFSNWAQLELVNALFNPIVCSFSLRSYPSNTTRGLGVLLDERPKHTESNYEDTQFDIASKSFNTLVLPVWSLQ